jgi:uncharacterized protein (UPF0210 family)
MNTTDKQAVTALGTDSQTCFVRTVTLGDDFDFAKPQLTTDRANVFFDRVEQLFGEHGIASRTFRLTSPPLDQFFPGDWDDSGTPEQISHFGQAVEKGLTQAWFCLAGPQFLSPGDNIDKLDYIVPLLRDTEHVFTNTMVSSSAGVHIDAIKKSAGIVRKLATVCEKSQANFRFAVMSNVKANAPYFPASYHQGKRGFSVSLELAELANQVFAQDKKFDLLLAEFSTLLAQKAAPVVAACQTIAADQQVEFKGIDFSLAPFPGEGTSVMTALESLSGAKGGQFDMQFPLYAVNQVLKTVLPDCPRVGFNGSMFSVLEDNCLAERVGQGLVGVKDLLSYATVCGCGLDMVPVALETREDKMAALMLSVSTLAMKWDKPLLTRLVPGSTCEDGLTKMNHDFLVNTQPIKLNPADFSFCAPQFTQSFYRNTSLFSSGQPIKGNE